MSSHPRPLYRGGRERIQFYYWMSIKPEYDVHHRLATKWLQREKEILHCSIAK